MEKAKYTNLYSDFPQNTRALVCDDLMVDDAEKGIYANFYCQKYNKNIAGTDSAILCGQYNRVGLCWVEGYEKYLKNKKSG